MKKKALIILSLFSFFFISQRIFAQENALPKYLDTTKPIEERIENALSLMTIEEKIALCHAQSKFSSKGVPRLGIPQINCSDGPHGIRAEVKWDDWSTAGWTNDSCTAFPALTCLAATFNPQRAADYGKSIGEEAKYRDKNILLGPGVNIYRTPLNGRNFEYMGEDPYLSSVMCVPYIREIQKCGVAACVKHYILNNQETDRMSVNVNLSDRALNEIYLPAFKAAVEKGKVWSIMGSYNLYKNQHCCHNDYTLNKILKNDWHFDGIVISDWGGTHNSKEAILNGLDLEMGTNTNGFTSQNRKKTYRDYYLADTFIKGIQKGNYPISILNDKASRILRLIFRTSMSGNRTYGKFVCKSHSDAARKIAEEGIVLLKNKENFFPIKKNKNLKIAVIGENATKDLISGGGSSGLKVKYSISPLSALKQYYGNENITYAKGYSSGPSVYNKVIEPKENQKKLNDKAIEIAKKADIVLYIGGLNKNHHQDCENGDRLSYNLPFNQDKLIEGILKVNKNLGIILISGNAVEMPWIKKVKGLIQSWYLGSEAGNSLTEIISGQINPSGKLPFSYPKKLKDSPAHFYDKEVYPGQGNQETYKEDLLVGYRWFDTKKIEPLFPFGYGLSYTKFRYGKIKANKKSFTKDENIFLKMTVKNIGNSKGKEVIQIYSSQKNPALYRPQKELKAFKKIELNPNQEKEITFIIKPEELAFFNDNSKKWQLQSDKYIFHCATSSKDIKSKVVVSIN